MPSIAALAAAVFAFFALALLVPATAAVFYSDWQAVEAFLIVASAYGIFSVLTIMALTPKLRRLSGAEVFFATIAMWLSLCCAAVLPFILIENQNAIGSIFEAVSASVTLGVTFVPKFEISPVMALYRGMVAWQGGLLTLLLAVYVLGRYEVGGTSNRHLRFVLHSFQSGDPRIVQTFFEVFVPYLSMTLICVAALVLARTAPGDAFNVAINVVSTNGFLSIETGASILNNFAGEVIMMIFMLLGATSIIWHRTLVIRKWQQAREQTEISAFLLTVVLLAGSAALVALIVPSENFSAGEAALNAVFDTISVVTTTGITHEARFGVVLPFELILAISIVGGCSYSTAGGLKIFRVASMLHHSRNEIRRLVYPHAVLANSVDDSAKELRRAKAIWSALFIAIITVVVATLLFSLQGIDLASSLGLAVGSFSSTGNIVASSAGSDPANTTIMTIAVVGLLARIELLVALAAIGRSSW